MVIVCVPVSSFPDSLVTGDKLFQLIDSIVQDHVNTFSESIWLNTSDSSFMSRLGTVEKGMSEYREKQQSNYMSGGLSQVNKGMNKVRMLIMPQN